MGELSARSESEAVSESFQDTEVEAVSALLIYVEEILKEQGSLRSARAVFDADAVLRDEFSMPTRIESLRLRPS